MSETVEVASTPDAVRFVIDEDLYPRDAVLGASYLFVDRCWILLDRPGDKQIGVRLKPKTGSSVTLEAIEGEFCNELLNQVLRIRVGDATRQLREYTMARAFFGDDTQTSIDALLAELDAEELADDDLEIAVPWEQAPAE